MMNSPTAPLNEAILDALFATPETAAGHLREALSAMFPGRYVNVVSSSRGVGIQVARRNEEENAKYQLFRSILDAYQPNQMVRIVISPEMDNFAWAGLVLRPAKNRDEREELKALGITPLRMESKLTPGKAVQKVLAWFRKNENALKASV
jgi:hypothetical protein